MRNGAVQLCLVIIGISSIHAVRLLQGSSVIVKISPAEGAEKVWAVHGADSLEMSRIDNTWYLRNLYPGRWQIKVSSKVPFRDASLEINNIQPGDDQDLGDIRLQQ
jgi:hypothetical protein